MLNLLKIYIGVVIVLAALLAHFHKLLVAYFKLLFGASALYKTGQKKQGYSRHYQQVSLFHADFFTENAQQERPRAEEYAARP